MATRQPAAGQSRSGQTEQTQSAGTCAVPLHTHTHTHQVIKHLSYSRLGADKVYADVPHGRGVVSSSSKWTVQREMPAAAKGM
jgi:hypothetical protein